MANSQSQQEEMPVRKFNSRSSTWDVLEGIDLTGKTAVITGCNTGIGSETARALAVNGAHVVMANRNIVQSEKLKEEIVAAKPDAKVDLVHCDLSSLQSVESAAQQIIDKKCPIHMLILNAGVFGPSQKATIDGYEMTFGVNHLAHFYFVQLLMPTLRESKPSRVVVVSSISHADTGISASLDTESKLQKLIPKPESTEMGYKLYAYSKLCNVLFAFALHTKEHDNGVNVYVLHPGTMIATDIARNYGFWNRVYKVVVKPFTKSLAQGAATNVYCATNPELEQRGGKFYESCWDDEKSLQTDLARDEDLQNALWLKSEQLINEFRAKK